MPLESKIVTRGIQSAQSQVESRNFEIRKNVLKYDDVMSRQRVVIYEQRRRVLEGEDLHEQVQHFRSDVLTAYITGATDRGSPGGLGPRRPVDRAEGRVPGLDHARTRSSSRPAAPRGCPPS